VHALGELIGGRHRNLQRDEAAGAARLVGQVHLVARELRVPPRAERGVRRRRDLARHPEQLREADVVEPEGVALGVVQGPHEQLVVVQRRVGQHGGCPQHQLRVERVEGRAGRERAGVLGQFALHPRVHPVDRSQHAIGLRAGAEEDRLERVRGPHEPAERPLAPAGRLRRAGVVDRLERADRERPLTEEQADEALVVHLAQHGSPAWEVALVERMTGHAASFAQGAAAPRRFARRERAGRAASGSLPRHVLRRRR